MKLRQYPKAVTQAHYIWDTTINSVPHSYVITSYDSIDPDSSSPPVINLNGIGEGKYSVSVAPKILGANIASPILPFKGELELTPANIERIAIEVPELVAVEALKKINKDRPNEHKFTSIDMIARSQGGASGIRAASENKALFNRIALIMPFGLNNEQLGDSTEERRIRVLQRLALAATKANPFDYGNLRSTAEVSSYLLQSLSQGNLMDSLDAALSFNLVDTVIELSESKDVAVFVGKSDPLFKASEVSQNLASSNIEVITVKGSHSTPGSQRGRQHLRTAYNWLHPDIR